MVLTRWLEERLLAFDKFNASMGLMLGVDPDDVVDWEPNFAVTQTPDEYTITAELPGCRLDDVHALLEGETLKLVGCREVRADGEKGLHLHSELSKFRHEIELPGAAKVDPVDLRIHEGVLTVVIPKAPVAVSA